MSESLTTKSIESIVDSEIYAANLAFESARITSARADAVYAHAVKKGWALNGLRKDREKFARELHDAGIDREVANAKYEGWTRYFLVNNSNGHIHPSMNCSTCNDRTNYNWLTDLSGLTLSEVVAEYGEIVCSICYPDAPVAWSKGTNKKEDARKIAEAALKAIAKSPEGKKVRKLEESISNHVYNRKSAWWKIDRFFDNLYSGYPSDFTGVAETLDRMEKHTKSIARATVKLVLAEAALAAALNG
jgi:hypothetical protein